MSTFNLSEMAREGKVSVRLAVAKAAAAPEPAKPDPLDDCPQCDGSGREDGMGGLPSVCRRCGGAGTVERLSKTAAIEKAGDAGMEKVAQFDDLPEIPDTLDDEQPPEGGLGDESSGIMMGEMGAPGRAATDRQLRFEIGSMIRPRGPQDRLAIYDIACQMLEVPESEKQRKITTADGSVDDDAAMDFIAEALDKMDLQQLKALDARIRQII